MGKKLIVDGNLLGRKSFYKFRNLSTELKFDEAKGLSPSVARTISSTLDKTVKAPYREKTSESTGNKLVISTKGDIDNRLDKVLKLSERHTIQTGVLYGMLKSILAASKNYDADKVVICYDPPPIYKMQENRPTPKRKALDVDYKVRKKDMSTEMLFAVSLQLAQSFFYRLGITQVSTKTFEADDLLQRFTQHIFKDDDCLVLTNDHDLFQLLEDDRVSLLRIGTNNPLYTAKDFTIEYGINPSQWLDVQMIGGCPTDSVKGIPGISPDTAVKLMQKYGDIKRMFKKYKKNPYSTKVTNILNKEAKNGFQNIRKAYSLVRLYGLHPKLEKEIMFSESDKSKSVRFRTSIEFLSILEFKSFLTKNGLKSLKSLIIK